MKGVESGRFATKRGPAPFYHESKTAASLDPAITNAVLADKCVDYFGGILDELVAHLVTYADLFAAKEEEGDVVHLWLAFEFDPSLDTTPRTSDLRQQFALTSSVSFACELTGQTTDVSSPPARTYFLIVNGWR